MDAMNPIHKFLATPALCLAAGAYCPQVKAAPRHESSGNCYLARVSMDKLCWLPHVVGAEASKKAYEAISFQAVSTGGTLSISIRNTGRKDIILRSTGVHIRLWRAPFYVLQGKKQVRLPLSGSLEIAAGEELRLSCPSPGISSNVVHVGFVSLSVVGEKVYDGLPERKVPIEIKE